MSPTSYRAALFRDMLFCGWGEGIRTPEYRYQKPRPYRLATPQDEVNYSYF